MYKQILGYIPSNIVPALVSFGMIYAYTRLLTPTEFGAYSFIFSAVMIAQISFFIAIPVAVMRFQPAADMANRRAEFLKEAYAIFYGVSLAVVIASTLASLIVGVRPEHHAIAWIGLPLLLGRSAILVNQAVNRSDNAMGRYNLIECTHAALGFILGLLFVLFAGPTARSVLLGLLIAAVVCAAIDTRLLLSPFRRLAGGRADGRPFLTQLVNYSWPLATVAMASSILQLSDRFLIGTLASAQMLGIYTVAYSLVERPTTLISSAISTATFSYVVQTLEKDGRDAGRHQLGLNGIVLIALTLPACVGLSLTSQHIAAVLVGPGFREGVAALIPIMCVTALIHGVRNHFVDHTFHLSGRSAMMLWTYGPAAAANVLINLITVPAYGMFGAAWTGLGCQVAALLLSWLVGRRVFPLWLPLQQVARIVLAVLAMAAAIASIDFPLTWLGLLGEVSLGAAVYIATCIGLDVGGARSLLRTRWMAAVGR